MQRSRRHSLMQSSLLDRLLDDDPRSSTEVQPETHYDVNRYKHAVARDLEALLNTRCMVADGDRLESFQQAGDSLLSFGITDLSSLSLHDPDDRLFLRDSIRRTLERHEPRLTKVRVSLDLARDSARVLKFRVDALLRVHPSRPPVTFDAMLHLSSNTYQVNR